MELSTVSSREDATGGRDVRRLWTALELHAPQQAALPVLNTQRINSQHQSPETATAHQGRPEKRTVATSVEE